MLFAMLHNPGDIVNNRYKVVDILGKGAMGEVFVATDRARGDFKLAMKYLKFVPGKFSALNQFKAEFATLTHLSHPNIAKVYDFEEDVANNQFFFTSELVEGVEFLTAAKTAGIEEIEDLFVQSLRALEYLHGNGIFHYDIKSANVLVYPSSKSQAKPRDESKNSTGSRQARTVKLIDFGLATIRFQGQLVGTPSYMAPEMVRKEDPDGRADLYSLGVLIYSALTGVNPFRAADMNATLKNQLELVPPPPSSNNQRSPGYLDTIVMKLMEKKAGDRYRTAAEAINDLSLRSPVKYEVETEETQSSYIPTESKFIGRFREIAKMSSLLKTKMSSIVIVKGAGGSGKTRLLNELKHLAQIEEWATVFLSERSDVDEFTKSVSVPLTQPTLFGIDDIDRLADDGKYPAVLEALQRLAQNIMARPAIILISAVENDKIPAFLNTKNTIVLELWDFNPGEIREYLSAVTGLPNPPQKLADQIFENTGGNPYLVSELSKTLVAMGTIVDSHGRWKSSTFEDIKIDVSKTSLPNNVEEKMLSDFAALPKDAKDMAELISALGRPLTGADAAAMTGDSNASGMLLMLMRRGVVKRDVKEGAYYFSRPIISGAIYKRMAEDARMSWHGKIAAVLGSHAIHPDIPSRHPEAAAEGPHESLEERLFHMGHSSLSDAARNALVELIERQLKGLKNKAAIINAKYYVERWNDPEIKLQLARLYNRTGKHELAIETAHQIECRVSGTEQKIATAEIIGIAYLRQKNLQKARETFEIALRTCVNIKTCQRLRLENFIGEVEYFDGSIDKAIELYERTAAEADKLPAQEQLQIKNNNLGQSYFQKGEYKRAIERLEKDFELYKNDDDHRLTARTKYMLAESYRIVGERDNAVKTFNDLIQHAKDGGDLEHLFRAYNGLGGIYNDNKQYKEAIECYERALDISSRLGTDNESITCVANMGVITSNMGDFKKAYEYFSAALAFLEGGHATGGIMEEYHCRVHLELGEICRINKKYDEARMHLEEAMRMAEASSNNEMLFWIYVTMFHLADDMKDRSLRKASLASASKLATTPEKSEILKKL